MNNAEKILVEQLIPALATAGFAWTKAREMFIRKEFHGFSSLSWTSHSTNEDGGRLELGPVLSVRHELVDDVVNKLGLVYGDDNKKFTATVTRGLAIFPFSDGEDDRQYVRMASADTDIRQAASNLISMMATKGESFFKQYSSLLECSRGLNDPIESKTHPLCNNFPRRAYYGTAASFFAENGRVHELVRQYGDFAKAILPNQYNQIAKRLDEVMSVAESRLTS